MSEGTYDTVLNRCTLHTSAKVDGDTVFSVSRLRSILSEYDPKVPSIMCNKALVISHRYGKKYPEGFPEFPTCLDGPVEVYSASAAASYVGNSSAKPSATGRMVRNGWPQCVGNASGIGSIMDAIGEDWWLDNCLFKELGTWFACLNPSGCDAHLGASCLMYTFLLPTCSPLIKVLNEYLSLAFLQTRTRDTSCFLDTKSVKLLVVTDGKLCFRAGILCCEVIVLMVLTRKV